MFPSRSDRFAEEESKLLSQLVDARLTASRLVAELGERRLRQEIGTQAGQRNAGAKPALKHGWCVCDPDQHMANSFAREFAGLAGDFRTVGGIF